MATVKFKLRNLETETSTVYAYVSIGRGKQFLCATDIKIEPRYWKSNKKGGLWGFPKQVNNANVKKKRKRLEKIQNELPDKIEDAIIEGVQFNSNWVKENIDRVLNKPSVEEIEKKEEALENNKLTTHTQKFIDNAPFYKRKDKQTVGLSENRIKGLKTFKNTVIRYEDHINETIFLKNINKSFEEKFNRWLLDDMGYSKNYAGKILSNLAVICKDADAHKIEVDPYALKVSGYKQKSENKIIQTLSFEEIDQIRSSDLNSESLENARDWLVLGCYIGQRASDLLNLTNDNVKIRNGSRYIELIQQKTGTPVVVRLVKEANEIVSRRGIPRKISLQKLNKYIKAVCRIAKIDEVVEGDLYDKEKRRKVRGHYPKHQLITSHSFRRSYATNYYKNVPTPLIMHTTGHKKESSFYEYIDKPKDLYREADMLQKFIDVMEKEREEKTNQGQMKVI